jgi:hypothetical protein
MAKLPFNCLRDWMLLRAGLEVSRAPYVRIQKGLLDRMRDEGLTLVFLESDLERPG